MSVSVCVCVCVCLVGETVENGLRQIRNVLPRYRSHKSHQTLYSATLYLMNLTYFLKVKDSNLDQLGRLNVVITQTVTDICAFD